MAVFNKLHIALPFYIPENFVSFNSEMQTSSVE